jgi:hypothetical protein
VSGIDEVEDKMGHGDGAGQHDLKRHLERWEPVISGLVAADHGDPAAGDTVDKTLAALANHRDWQELVAVIRRIRAGARDPSLATRLDPIDTAIVHRALDALAGTAQVNTDAWRTLTTEQLVDLVATTVAAASGDPDATSTLEPLLDELAAHPDWASFAATLQRIIVGERDPACLHGLDHTCTAVVTMILDQLNPHSETSIEPPQRRSPGSAPPETP